MSDDVEKASERAKAYLWSLYRAKKAPWPQGARADGTGGSPERAAMVIRAMLAAGRPTRDPRMERAIDWLANSQADSIRELSLRCRTWSALRWSSREKARPLLRADAKQVFQVVSDGAFATTPDGKTRPDANVRAAWVTRALIAADRARLEVPTACWQVMLTHWIRAQSADGGWGPGPRKPSDIPTTATGVLAVHTCRSRLNATKFATVGKDSSFKPVERGLAWLDGHFPRMLAGQHRGGEDLSACLVHMQEAAAATGRWRFAGRDLYRAGATVLLKSQRPDGSWPGESAVPATAGALNFLARGGQALLLGRLKHAGDWCNRPDAPANLADWINRGFCLQLGWQNVDAATPVGDWPNTRIILITGSAVPKFTSEQIRRLRVFALRGGTIFSCTEGNGAGFSRGIRELYKDLFPGRTLKACAPDHPLSNVFFRLKRQFKVYEVSNGLRPLAIHCDEDLPLAWQMNMYLTMRDHFKAPLNLVLYVTAKGDFRSYGLRGDAKWPAEPKLRPRLKVALARIKHAGNCDPEPLAWERFARLMGRDQRVKVNVLGPLPAEKLGASGARLAVLFGTLDPALDAAAQTALKRFVAAGGTLLVAAGGGSKPFAGAGEAMLERLYGREALRKLPASSPIYRIEGLGIEKVEYTSAMREVVGAGLTGPPRLRGVTVNGRLAVIYSREDITSALLGYEFHGSAGYRPEFAFELMRNITLHAAGAKRTP